jgi:hypothetical protein
LPQAPSHRVLHAQLRVLTVTRLHAGKPATSAPVAGDTVTVSGGAIRRNGKHIGRSDVTCTFTTPEIELCYVVDHLPGGTIVHIGAEPTDKPGRDAIAGGLGRYQGIHGSVTTAFTSANSASLTYDIRR